MANRICSIGYKIISFKGLISNCNALPCRGLQSYTSKVVSSSASSQIYKFIPQPLVNNTSSVVEHDILNFSTPRLQILDRPIPIDYNIIIESPVINSNITYEDKPPEKEIEDPKPFSQEEKHAVRMIVIRKKKMRVHKRKKHRKKYKFLLAKIRRRRKTQKEKLFNAELMAKIKEAEKFDPAIYISQKIQKANEVIIPRRWKGKRLPEFIIRDLIELRKKKIQKIKDNIERRKNMNVKASDYQ